MHIDRRPITFHEETGENRDNPPENSSRTRKGSKYFSSNLQKPEVYIYIYIPLAQIAQSFTHVRQYDQ
jgi:hypothetical protein